jgi:hypothetical protein
LKAWEAIMSSPIHLDKHADLELIYAPRRARERFSRSAETSPIRNPSSVKSKPRFSGDRAMLKLQRQLALDPDSIPEPSAGTDAVIRPLLIRLCSVTALAAFAAWGLVSYSDVRRTAEVVPPSRSAPAIASNQEVMALQPLPLRPSISQIGEAHPAVGKSPSIVVATADGASIAPEIPATSAPRVENPTLSPAPPPQRANDRRALRLDSDEIASLVKRGQDFIANGDLAAARLLLRRAAEAGSAEGALTLGTTYDPIVLQRLGAVGTAPDAAQARQWYQRAAELGSTAASQQLAGLGEAR